MRCRFAFFIAFSMHLAGADRETRQVPWYCKLIEPVLEFAHNRLDSKTRSLESEKQSLENSLGYGIPWLAKFETWRSDLRIAKAELQEDRHVLLWYKWKREKLFNQDLFLRYKDDQRDSERIRSILKRLKFNEIESMTVLESRIQACEYSLQLIDRGYDQAVGPLRILNSKARFADLELSLFRSIAMTIDLARAAIRLSAS